MRLVIPITIKGHVLQAELALTRQERIRGLMGRSDLPPDGALLMCYPQPMVPMIWMKDTPLPLTVAFLNDDKQIFQTADLTPFDPTIHQAKDWTAYTLEVHQGWLEAHRIRGRCHAHFELPEGVRAS